jgi:uncharacterized protein (TIGR02186 family)
MKKNHTTQISRYVITTTILAFTFCVLHLAISGPALAMLTAKANHSHITVDFFYHGSTVSVRGISEPGTDIVVKITSPEGHRMLKKKGKVAGLLWMNIGQIEFDRAPDFYELFSTKKVEDILSREEREKYLIGYSALGKHVEMTPVSNEAEKTGWFEEYVKYKESSKEYATSYGTIETAINAEGKQEYRIFTQWPYQAQPGDYLVSVYAVKNNKILEQAQANVKVEQVGLVKTLANMAKNRAIIYGLLSILIALGAGFGVGMVFKGGGGH